MTLVTIVTLGRNLQGNCQKVVIGLGNGAFTTPSWFRLTCSQCAMYERPSHFFGTCWTWTMQVISVISGVFPTRLS